VEGVTVLWFAMDPDSGDRVVVGWYKDAKVWSERHDPDKRLEKSRTTKGGEICDFTIESADTVLLKPGKRPRLLPGGRTRKGRPGQNPFWYGNPKVDERAMSIIAGAIGREPNSSSRKLHVGWIQDTEERMRIEKRAMEYVMKVYEEDGYKSRDVSAEKVGYDIHALSSSSELHLEVKGKKGNEVRVELTPNELRFAKLNRGSFRVCVVLDALGKKCRLVELQYNRGNWFDREGNKFEEDERPGLVISG